MSGDRILIRNLLVRGILGINDWERERRQDILINLEIERDLRPAAASDEVADALNYRSLAKAVIAHVEASSYRLVETLAESIASLCLQQGAVRIKVRVEKPGALRFAESVGVEIERGGDD